MSNVQQSIWVRSGFFLATCEDSQCASEKPMVFKDPELRDRWADEHAGAGHVVNRVDPR